MSARRGVLAALGAVLAAGPLAAQAAPVRVELDGLPARAFVQQPFDVVVRIVVDRQWLAERAVPLHQQRLDRPFHVVVPWLAATDAHEAVALPPADGAVVARVAVGDRALPCTVDAAAGPAAGPDEVLVLRCRVAALAPGDLVLPPVQVRYAFGTRFQDDFLRGRQPLDRQEATANGPAGAVAIAALPTPAPAGFFGAVGVFSLRAAAAAPRGEVGAGLAVTLELDGRGNFARMATPTALAVPGCHLQGVTVARTAAGCRFGLDLLPLREASAVGPFAVVVFDPERQAYTTLQAPAVPCAIAPSPRPDALPARVQELVAAEAARTAGPWLPWWGYLVAVGLLLGLGLVLRQRALAQRARRAAVFAERATAALPHDAAAALGAFDGWLQARTGASPAGGAAWQALLASGVAPDVVAELQALHAALDAARFGGAVPAAAVLRSALARATA